MTTNRDSVSDVKPEDRSLKNFDLPTLLRWLERDLVTGAPEVRRQAIDKLCDLGTDARPSLYAVVRAIGDVEFEVGLAAWRLFEELQPDESNLVGWQMDERQESRLAVVEEIVRLLPTIAPGQARSDTEQAGPTKEDLVQPSTQDPIQPHLQGKWIAWDENQERVLASADTFPELIEIIQSMGLENPPIERAPGLHPKIMDGPFELLDGESPDILDDIRGTIPDADRWLDSPNTRLGCEKPRKLLGTPEESQVRSLLRGLWNGISS